MSSQCRGESEAQTSLGPSGAEIEGPYQADDGPGFTSWAGRGLSGRRAMDGRSDWGDIWGGEAGGAG